MRVDSLSGMEGRRSNAIEVDVDVWWGREEKQTMEIPRVHGNSASSPRPMM